MPIEGPVRVLVVDDHAGIRHGIANLIDAERPRMLSVGAAATVDEALAQTREQQPDVVVLDVNLGGEDGLALIPALRHAAPCEIVVLTCLADPHVAVQARRLGACACLHKTAPAAELLACILAAGRADEQAATAPPANGGGALSYAPGSKHPSAMGDTADADPGTAA
jgi:DNA-binding NarL/FixJ family response regulator